LKDKNNYILWHCLRIFFENLEEWQQISPILGITSSLSQEEYNKLLKGTWADVYVPLWASCAKSETKLLLDKTTLGVIKRYKEFGYVAVDMDGNPPDYIGQQFRFLEYLARCNLKESNIFTNETSDFIDDYTLDTVRVVIKALLTESIHPEIMRICSVMSDVISGKDIPVYVSEDQIL
jgi:anaerobic dimethyl sulfoxide reductase subunit A